MVFNSLKITFTIAGLRINKLPVISNETKDGNNRSEEGTKKASGLEIKKQGWTKIPIKMKKTKNTLTITKTIVCEKLIKELVSIAASSTIL